MLANIILPCVQHETSDIRDYAVKALGLFSLLSFDEAKSRLPLLLEVLKNDEEEIKLTAITAIFDLILVFGRMLQSQETESITFVSVIEELKPLLAHEIPEFRTAAAEGFSKLFINNVCSDNKVTIKGIICRNALLDLDRNGSLLFSSRL
jgi:condensin complex subunit 3